MSKLAVANIIFETTESNRIEYTGNNVVRVRANGGVQLPFGTTAQRASPEYGLLRYNTDTGTVEMYDAGGWFNMPTGGYVNNIYTTANAAYALANNVAPQIAPSYNNANAAFRHANAAYDSANNVAPQVTPAFNTANLAFLNSNVAFNTANAAFASANNVAPQVTPAFLTANLAYLNSNAAFNAANTKFSSSGGSISGAVEINADLTVRGNTRFIDQETLAVGDPLIYLAANNYSSDIVDIGFIANYVNATSVNVHTGLFRSSASKEYYLFQGYDKEPYNNYIDPTGNNFTIAILNSTIRTSNLILGGANAINWINAAYTAANNVNLGPAYDVANAAFAKANTGMQNTTFTLNGSLTIANTNTISAPIWYENEANITASYTLTAGRNAMTAGPVTLNTGITVTVPVGSTWTIV